MTARLRHRAARMLRRHPLLLVRVVTAYLAKRRAIPRALERDALDDALRLLDGPRSVRGREPPAIESLSLGIEIGDAVFASVGSSHVLDTCLVRALARYALARELGLAPSFVIGVDPSRVAAADVDAIGHAWIEIAGRPVPAERLAAHVVSFRHPPDPPLQPFPARDRARHDAT